MPRSKRKNRKLNSKLNSKLKRNKKPRTSKIRKRSVKRIKRSVKRIKRGGAGEADKIDAAYKTATKEVPLEEDQEYLKKMRSKFYELTKEIQTIPDKLPDLVDLRMVLESIDGDWLNNFDSLVEGVHGVSAPALEAAPKQPPEYNVLFTQYPILKTIIKYTPAEELPNFLQADIKSASESFNALSKNDQIFPFLTVITNILMNNKPEMELFQKYEEQTFEFILIESYNKINKTVSAIRYILYEKAYPKMENRIRDEITRLDQTIKILERDAQDFHAIMNPSSDRDESKYNEQLNKIQEKKTLLDLVKTEQKAYEDAVGTFERAGAAAGADADADAGAPAGAPAGADAGPPHDKIAKLVSNYVNNYRQTFLPQEILTGNCNFDNIKKQLTDDDDNMKGEYYKRLCDYSKFMSILKYFNPKGNEKIQKALIELTLIYGYTHDKLTNLFTDQLGFIKINIHNVDDFMKLIDFKLLDKIFRIPSTNLHISKKLVYLNNLDKNVRFFDTKFVDEFIKNINDKQVEDLTDADIRFNYQDARLRRDHPRMGMIH